MPERITPDGEQTITTTNLATLFGITPESVRQLTARGVMAQTGRVQGEYALFDTVAAYTRHLREAAAGRSQSERMQRAKLTKAEAEANLKVLEFRQGTGELLEADQIEKQWVAIMRVASASLRALPSRIAQQLNLDNTGKAAVAAEIDDALEDLASNGAEYVEQEFEDVSNEAGDEGGVRSATATAENENVGVRGEAD